MTVTSVDHATFVVERMLPGRPPHAFRFWSEHDLKRRWTSCHPDWTVLEDSFDFRVGGSEVMRWRTMEGETRAFRAHYLDIVPGERIVYGYDMSLGAKRLSVSLATVVFAADGAQTRMTFTEQAAVLDVDAGIEMRASGTGSGFDRLAAAMALQSALN
ncbi:ATPase-like activator of Hsp90 [Bradyrhizobiaceae bacterium SG-6C]|nr:ATPase-like activator of Hsp90 [Bradyrhizobiaceae bacterium SG-6C]